MLTLLNELKLLRQNGPKHATLGICDNITDKHAFEELADRWPNSSGNLCYPVPHPTLPPEQAFYAELDLWSGAYGDNRKELLEWAIKELENETTPSDA